MASKPTSQPQITVYRGWKDSGAYVWSPFVTKVEARLRLAGLSYHTEAGSLSKAPKGKIPYVTITEMDLGTNAPANSWTFADSTLIIDKLVENGLLDNLNANLSTTEKAHDLALRALLEDKLYFYHTYERWIDNYYSMRAHVLSALPWPAQVVVGHFIYRNARQTLHGQGTGRLSADEIRSFRQQIWESIHALLDSAKRNVKADDSDGPFWILGGDGPSEADMVLFGFIVSVLLCTAAPESQKVVRSFPTILDYAQRIHDRYFPDYVRWK